MYDTNVKNGKIKAKGPLVITPNPWKKQEMRK